MPEKKNGLGPTRMSRRTVLRGVGAGVVGSAVVGGTAVMEHDAAAAGQASATAGPGTARFTLNINGKDTPFEVEPRTTMLSALRNHMPPNDALTGSKPGCEMGTCGACSVMVDGKVAYSCLLLAIDMQGKKITTIEGLARGGKLTAVQQAMVDQDGYMCGFCTPGFVISITALLAQKPNPTLDEVKEGVAGNLCRCGAYPNIFKAAMQAARQGRGGQ